MMKRLTEELAAQFMEAPVNQWVAYLSVCPK